MITREDYLNALELIDQYHQQLNLSDVRRSSSSDKVKIKDWDKLSQCSIRLQNILLEYYDRKFERKIECIDDINRTNFLRQRNAGKGSWKEFCKIAELNYA